MMKDNSSLTSVDQSAAPSAVDVLRAARKLLTPRKAWTQGYYAHGASGRKVSMYSRAAVCWCSQGAIWKAVHDIPDSRSFDAEQFLLATLPSGEEWIVEFNDNKKRKHREILEWFDRAIHLAIAKPVTK